MEEHEHLVKRTLVEYAYYPEHPPRKATALYNHNHHQMTRVEDLPCAMCGVRQSTLKDPVHNVLNSQDMETHHCQIEESLTLAIDLNKFNRLIRVEMLTKTQDVATYGHLFTQEEMEEWIRGHRGNLEVYCDVCHRSTAMGIHWISYPVFSARRLVKDDFDLLGCPLHEH